MGLRIIAGTRVNEGTRSAAVLYCSTSMTTLPFIFEDQRDAERFIERHGDIRGLPWQEQSELFSAWINGERSYPVTAKNLKDDDYEALLG